MAWLRAGAVVFLADRDSKQLEIAMERLRSHGGRVHSMTVDVTKQEQVQRLIQEAASRHGRLDFLFNNAGIGGTLPIEEATLEHWRRIIDINLWGVIYGVDAALPIMRRQGGGHIVNTSSIAGVVPIPYQALSCQSMSGSSGGGIARPRSKPTISCATWRRSADSNIKPGEPPNHSAGSARLAGRACGVAGGWSPVPCG